MHLELVIEFKDGSRDWIDPVEHEDVKTFNGKLIAVNQGGHIYEYDLSSIEKWAIREYSYETTYNKIGE